MPWQNTHFPSWFETFSFQTLSILQPQTDVTIVGLIILYEGWEAIREFSEILSLVVFSEFKFKFVLEPFKYSRFIYKI